MLLRKPLLFDQLEGGRVWSPTTTSKRHTHRRPAVPDGFTAMSGHVMRGGRHFVEFTIDYSIAQYGRSTIYAHLGVNRPVSLTNGIDLEADWRGQGNPVAVSSGYEPAVAEKLRSQRTAMWGG